MSKGMVGFVLATNPELLEDIMNISSCAAHKAGKHPLLATAAVGGALVAYYCYAQKEQIEQHGEQHEQQDEPGEEQDQGQGWVASLSKKAQEAAEYIGF